MPFSCDVVCSWLLWVEDTCHPIRWWCGRRTSGANYRRGVSSVLRSTACRGECHKFGAGCRTVAGMYIVCFFGALFSLRENSSLCRLDCPKEDTEGRCRLPRSVPEGVGARCRPVAGGRYRSCYGDIGRGMQGFEPNFYDLPNR